MVRPQAWLGWGWHDPRYLENIKLYCDLMNTAYKPYINIRVSGVLDFRVGHKRTNTFYF